MDPHTYRLDDTLGFSIYRVAMRLRAELSQRLRAHGLTSEQFGLLARLWEEDGINQRLLAERNFKDRPNVTRMLDRLVAKRLVERRRDPNDRRAHNVYLTSRGRAIRSELAPILAGLRADAYEGVDDRAQRELKSLLDRIYRNLSPEASPEAAVVAAPTARSGA